MPPVVPLGVSGHRVNCRDVLDVACILLTQRTPPSDRVIPQLHIGRSMSYIVDCIQMELLKSDGKTCSSRSSYSN